MRSPSSATTGLAIYWGQLRESVRGQLPELAWVLVVTALAKFGAVLPGYSIDDWAPSTQGTSGLFWDVITKGRFGHWLFLRVAAALELEPNPARILWAFLGIAAYALLGLAVVRFWRVGSPRWLVVAAACLIANHPYTSEIFTFRIGLPLAALVMALLSLLLWIVTRARFHFLAASAVFAAAVSFYPIALHFGFMIVLTGLALGLARHPAVARGRDAVDSESHGEVVDRRALRLLAAIGGGLVLWGLAGGIIGKLLGANGDYFRMLDIAGVPARVLEVAKGVLGTFVRPNGLIPSAVNVCFLVIAGSLAAALLWRVGASRERGRALLLSATTLVLLGGALLWSGGVYLILQSLWLVPRNMAQVGIFWSACIVLAAQLVPGLWWRRALAALAAVIVLAFIGVNQLVFEEQRRLNTRDMNMANRVVARLEALPGFELVRRVGVVGGFAWYPDGLQSTMWGDLNVSGFAAQWSRVPILREVSGYRLLWVTDPVEVAAAVSYCAAVEPWPGPEAVAVRGELAFLCLVRPPATPEIKVPE